MCARACVRVRARACACVRVRARAVLVVCVCVGIYVPRITDSRDADAYARTCRRGGGVLVGLRMCAYIHTTHRGLHVTLFLFFFGVETW